MLPTIPRSVLLPEYMKSLEAWVTLANAIDDAFKESVDQPSTRLQRLREVIHLGTAAQSRILKGLILDESDLERFDRETLLRCLTLVGSPIRDYTPFSDDQLFRLLQNLPTYWYSKGSKEIVDFISFVLGADFEMRNLWTTDYVAFVPEGDPSIGLSVVEGGDWYPTSHVEIEYDPFQVANFDPLVLLNLLDDLLNYNLVVWRTSSRTFAAVQQAADVRVPYSEYTGTPMVALSSYTVVNMVIANFNEDDPPPPPPIETIIT